MKRLARLFRFVETRYSASLQPVHNHEMWHNCTMCGKWFDRRLHGDNCPDCGTNVNALV